MNIVQGKPVHNSTLMNIKNIVFVVILFISVTYAFAQKVKYKDVFALVERKQYDSAEPLLKNYLETNQDNPNAFLYMGIIYMERHYKAHSMQESKQAQEQALKFLNRAKVTLNEREVSRNEKYYSAYKRRNVRSGKMEVRLSDIIYDIDNRIKKLTTEGGGG